MEPSVCRSGSRMRTICSLTSIAPSRQPPRERASIERTQARRTKNNAYRQVRALDAEFAVALPVRWSRITAQRSRAREQQAALSSCVSDSGSVLRERQSDYTPEPVRRFGGLSNRHRDQLQEGRRMNIESPAIPYNFADLEPAISRDTVVFHFLRHQRVCFDRMLAMVRGTELEPLSLVELIRVTERNPAQHALYRYAAEVYNHNLYWNSMHPGGGARPPGSWASGCASASARTIASCANS